MNHNCPRDLYKCLTEGQVTFIHCKKDKIHALTSIYTMHLQAQGSCYDNIVARAVFPYVHFELGPRMTMEVYHYVQDAD